MAQKTVLVLFLARLQVLCQWHHLEWESVGKVPRLCGQQIHSLILIFRQSFFKCHLNSWLYQSMFPASSSGARPLPRDLSLGSDILGDSTPETCT